MYWLLSFVFASCFVHKRLSPSQASNQFVCLGYPFFLLVCIFCSLAELILDFNFLLMFYRIFKTFDWPSPLKNRSNFVLMMQLTLPSSYFFFDHHCCTIYLFLSVCLSRWTQTTPTIEASFEVNKHLLSFTQHLFVVGLFSMQLLFLCRRRSFT